MHATVWMCLSGTMRQSIAQRPKNSTVEREKKDKETLKNWEKDGKKM